jgi:hypothetical protein
MTTSRVDTVNDSLEAPLTKVLEGRGGRWINRALLMVSALALAGWLFLSVAHLNDRYQVLHVQGAWMGLAEYANEGTLYPPLYDGERYGGTRWMPLPILVNAAAARISGEYLMSGKVVALTMMAVLLFLVFRTLRSVACPLTLSVALAGTILATDQGRNAGTTLGGDLLPVVLQLGALLTATSGWRRGLPAAGVLAGLAVASKTTGLWAALAICTWLVIDRRWRDLAFFSVIFVAVAGLILGAVEVISNGRFSDNLRTLSLAGVGGGAGPIRAPNQVLLHLARSGPAIWALLPLALLGAATGAGWRRLSPYHLALGWALALLLVVYTDVGTSFNQLLDVTVLTVVAIGYLAGRLQRSRGQAPLAVGLALVLLWGAGTGVVLSLVPDIRGTLRGEALAYPTEPLAGRVGSEDELLSEDPYVPLSFGRKPAVLDPFMLRRLDSADPEAVDDLIHRIEEKEFAYVVMVLRLEGNDYWWENFHFGPRVIDALRNAYVREGQVDFYHLYRPAP